MANGAVSSCRPSSSRQHSGHRARRPVRSRGMDMSTVRAVRGRRTSMLPRAVLRPASESLTFDGRPPSAMRAGQQSAVHGYSLEARDVRVRRPQKKKNTPRVYTYIYYISPPARREQGGERALDRGPDLQSSNRPTRPIIRSIRPITPHPNTSEPAALALHWAKWVGGACRSCPSGVSGFHRKGRPLERSEQSG